MSGAGGSGDGGKINISELSIEQLMALKERVQEELDLHANQQRDLKRILTKYDEARFALTPLTPDVNGRELLIPLSPALCVVGNVRDVDSILCDVGAGFYVEKSVADANEFISRKSELTRQSLQQVQRAIQQKSKLVEQCDMVARAKAAAQ